MADEDLEGADIWGDSNDNNNSTSSAANPAVDESENKNDEDENMLDDETRHMSTAELKQRIHLLDNDIRIMRSDVQRIAHESRGQNERIRENVEKVKLNKQLPYLVGNVVEVLEPDAEDGTFNPFKNSFFSEIKINFSCNCFSYSLNRSRLRC